MAACLEVPVHIIGPTGFDSSDRALVRAGLDYLDQAEVHRHRSWYEYKRRADADGSARDILLTTRAETPYAHFSFQPGDILLLGRESAGVPEEVHDAAHARLRIPMREDMRSLNVAVAAAMVLGEALRQTGGFGPLS